jgi:hypothetical protein
MDLYSKRKKAVENPPTEFRYDLPDEFRNQVWHIWKDAIGYVQNPTRTTVLGDRFGLEGQDRICSLYARISETLCDELGAVRLPGSGPCDALFRFFLASDSDVALSVIEVSFAGIFAGQDSYDFMTWVSPQLKAEDAVKKLNMRFQEHSIGYRLEQGRIVRLDSEFLHTETTEPAFRLLYQHGYQGALDEFMMAHKHFRQGQAHYDDCLTNCLKSLESTLKTICDRRKWKYNPLDTASKLFDSVFSNGIIPNYLQSHFSGLRCALESGVPTIRNREGGH